jgi:hypothetical protein
MNTSHTGYPDNCIPPCYIGDRAAYITAHFTSHQGNLFTINTLPTDTSKPITYSGHTNISTVACYTSHINAFICNSCTGIKACLFYSLYMSITAWNHVSLHFTQTSNTCKIAYHNQINVSRHNHIIVCVCV